MFESVPTVHYRQLASLGLPIVIGQLGSIILAFADTLMIGHHSTDELAAAAFVNTMFGLVVLTSLGFSYAVTPVVGRLYGEDKADSIGGVMKSALVANVLFMACMVLCMTVFYFNIHRMGQPDTLLPIMRPYFLIQLSSLPFVAVFNVFKQLFDGITATRTAMWVMLSANVLNIVGNYLLIYGIGGLPEMGLNGAGLSTMLSRVYMAVVLVAIFCVSRGMATYRRGWSEGRVNRAQLTHFCKDGMTLATQMGLETASFSLSAIMVGWLGVTALAAHQIMLTVSQLAFMVYYGLGAATAVRVSYFLGQRDVRQCRYSASACFNMIMSLAVVIATTLLISRHVVALPFTDNADVVQLVAMLILPFAAYQFGDGLQITYANALRAIGIVKPLMWAAFLAFVVVSLPLGYVLGIALDFGLVGIWSAFPISLTLAGLIYRHHFLKGVAAME